MSLNFSSETTLCSFPHKSIIRSLIGYIFCWVVNDLNCFQQCANQEKTFLFIVMVINCSYDGMGELNKGIVRLISAYKRQLCSHFRHQASGNTQDIASQLILLTHPCCGLFILFWEYFTNDKMLGLTLVLPLTHFPIFRLFCFLRQMSSLISLPPS